MDGYTVEEAASVLGVPRERVWELVARGVISGSTDLGGSMRVRLKADPPPEPAASRGDAPPSQSAETTPFRELLTEFRSLTERYGQALLALGEARGEVAGLRSRVEGLEARFDLRLPPASSSATSSWAASPWPTPNERIVEPSPEVRRVPPPAEASGDPPATDGDVEGSGAEHEDERGSQRRRPRPGRHATERFADALARAQDPSVPELPGAAETVAALAALRQDDAEVSGEAQDLEADASLPRELPAADTVPVADEPDLGSRQATDAPEAASPEDDAGGHTGESTAVEDSQPAPGAADSELGTSTPPGTDRTWDPHLYSAAIDEPEWLVADDEPDRPTAPAAASAAAEQEPQPEPPISEPATDAGPEAAAERESEAERAAAELESPAPEPESMSQQPEAAGSQEPKVAAPAPEPPGMLATESSGSRELDEALAALDAIGNPAPEPTDTPPSAAAPPPPRPEPLATIPVAPHRRDTGRPALPLPGTPRSPASRAYRRLRRIFPA